jgi:hypothetical protein
VDASSATAAEAMERHRLDFEFDDASSAASVVDDAESAK